CTYRRTRWHYTTLDASQPPSGSERSSRTTHRMQSASTRILAFAINRQLGRSITKLHFEKSVTTRCRSWLPRSATEPVCGPYEQAGGHCDCSSDCTIP